MKHVKRKFLNEHIISDDAYSIFKDGEMTDIDPNLNDDKVPFIVTTNQEFIQGFFYNLNGKKVIIPEPNPTVIYFSNAQGFLADLLSSREQLFEQLQNTKPELGEILNSMFAFYGCSVNFCSSLLDAIEAFVNSKIPKNYSCQNQKGKKMTKYEVIRFLTLENKIKTVLPDVFPNKNFLKAKSHLYESIKSLKKLRDDITHAKANMDFDVNYYENLFTDALDFDYLKAIESARDFINFYEEDLIEPCNCGLPH